MNNSGELFFDELANRLIYEAGFNQYKCKMSIYYKYASDDGPVASKHRNRRSLQL